MRNYAVILAGGIGSRFWPLSSELEPKQFLRLGSSKPMIEETISRVSRLIKKENLYIATNQKHYKKIKQYLRKFGIPFKNVLLEPESKNTLAPIGILSKRINDLDPEAVFAVLPCDHFVKNHNRFLKLLSRGMDIARRGYIVTLGIPPTRPETGYGYIKISPRPRGISSKRYYKVDEFIEKPDLKKVKGFLREKRYYWNSGIFIFRPDAMLKEMKKFQPEVYQMILRLRGKKYSTKLWHKLPCISIDYAVMQKTRNSVLLPADYGWIDLGSWRAIEELAKKDKDGNIFKGRCINIGSKNTLVWSDRGVVAALGLRDTIIVDTKDALLVCSKDRTQDVKKIVGLLKKKSVKKQT